MAKIMNEHSVEYLRSFTNSIYPDFNESIDEINLHLANNFRTLNDLIKYIGDRCYPLINTLNEVNMIPIVSVISPSSSIIKMDSRETLLLDFGYNQYYYLFFQNYILNETNNENIIPAFAKLIATSVLNSSGETMYGYFVFEECLYDVKENFSKVYNNELHQYCLAQGFATIQTYTILHELFHLLKENEDEDLYKYAVSICKEMDSWFPPKEKLEGFTDPFNYINTLLFSDKLICNFKQYFGAFTNLPFPHKFSSSKETKNFAFLSEEEFCDFWAIVFCLQTHKPDTFSQVDDLKYLFRDIFLFISLLRSLDEASIFFRRSYYGNISKNYFNSFTERETMVRHFSSRILFDRFFDYESISINETIQDIVIAADRYGDWLKKGKEILNKTVYLREINCLKEDLSFSEYLQFNSIHKRHCKEFHKLLPH